ncbi:MAG: hypothetical protein R2705_05355 [Ilumatobacteraceae bacterium]
MFGIVGAMAVAAQSGTAGADTVPATVPVAPVVQPVQIVVHHTTNGTATPIAAQPAAPTPVAVQTKVVAAPAPKAPAKKATTSGSH